MQELRSKEKDRSKEDFRGKSILQKMQKEKI